MGRLAALVALFALLPCAAFATTVSPTTAQLYAQDQYHDSSVLTTTVNVTAGTAPFTVASGNTAAVTATVSGSVVTLTWVGVSSSATTVTVTDAGSAQATISVSTPGLMSVAAVGPVLTVTEVGYTGPFTASVAFGAYASLSLGAVGVFTIIPLGSDTLSHPNVATLSDNHGGTIGEAFTTQLLSAAHLI